MISQNQGFSSLSPPDEPLRLVSEIAHEVTQVGIEKIPDILYRILETTRLLEGLQGAAVSLLDYVFNEQYTLRGEESPRTAHKISNLHLAPDFLSSFPASASRDASLVHGQGESCLIRVPVIAGSHERGLLYIISNQSLTLTRETKHLLETLASLAAVVLDRRRRQRDSGRLRDWLDAFWRVFSASRVPCTPEDVDRLLQVISDNACKIAAADFVVLYEYFEKSGDVRLPPFFSGSIREDSVMQSRGVAMEHRRSTIFRLLDLKKPFFAERAPQDWADAGLIDSQKYPQERSFFHRESVVSSAGIPLRIDGERVGILFVNYRTEQAFSAEFQEHLNLFANHAALAVNNTRLFLRSQLYSQNLEALDRIGKELGSAVTRDIHQIGQLIDEQTRTVIPTKNFFLCLYEADSNQFSLPYIRDEHDTQESLLPRLHQGLAAFVCRSGQTLFANREALQKLFAEDKAQPVGQPSVVWLGAPMVVRDRVVGALVVQDYKYEEAFNDEHRQLLTAIASQAAIAIDNYQLLRDAHLRLEELKALLDISQAFGSRMQTSIELFSSILDHVCKIASCTGSLLLLIDPGRSLLKVAASSSGLSVHVGKVLPIGEGLSGKVALTGKEEIQNDYAHWPERFQIFDPMPTRVCAVPLIWQGEIIGVMTLSSSEERSDLSQREIEILQRFAGPMAASVQNLRESSLRNALVHAGPNPIVAVDRHGRIITWNEEAAALFKYPEKTLVGERVTRLYWGGFEDAIKIQRSLEEGGKISHEEIFGRSREGEKIPLSLAAALLKDDTGEVMGSVGILQDLRLQSLRGRTQLFVEALREISQEEDLDEIAALVVVHAVDLLYADAGGLFLRDNSTFELRSSYRLNDPFLERLRGGGARSWLAMRAATDPQRIAFFPPGDSLEYVRLLSESQSSVLVPIRTDARLLGFLLIDSRHKNHFNADQKLIETLASQAAVSINRVQLLRYREETRQGLLVSANAVAVGQIATSFIHEAKNSLNGMTLTIHNLIEDIGSEPDLPEKKDYMERLSVVLSEMQRLDDLSRRLQKFTQQGIKPEKREVYLNDIVVSTLKLLASILHKKQIRLDTRLDPSLENTDGQGRGNPVLVDESQIQQVLMNLILNAVAASSERGPLLIETRNSKGNIEVRITDRGSGISSENKRKLFTPFFTTKKEGVGLGLFISKLMIEENHSGSIEVENTAPGKGTTFSIIIPKSA